MDGDVHVVETLFWIDIEMVFVFGASLAVGSYDSDAAYLAVETIRRFNVEKGKVLLHFQLLRIHPGHVTVRRRPSLPRIAQDVIAQGHRPDEGGIPCARVVRKRS